MAYEIRQSSDFIKIPGDIFADPNFQGEIIYFTLYANDEPLCRAAIVHRGDRWWIDYAFTRKDMRGQGIYDLIVKELNKTCIQKNIQYLYGEVRNKRPEDFAADRGVLPVEILGVKYGGVPINLKRWPEYQKAKNLKRAGVKTSFRTDLRPLYDSSSDNSD